jgi:hypothetical protein
MDTYFSSTNNTRPASGTAGHGTKMLSSKYGSGAFKGRSNAYNNIDVLHRGFGGEPAGYVSSGYVYEYGSTGVMWTSSSFSNSKAWDRAIYYNKSGVWRGTLEAAGLKSSYNSVRCLMD